MSAYLFSLFSSEDEFPDLPDSDLADDFLLEEDLTGFVDDEVLFDGALTDFPDPDLLSGLTLDLLPGVEVDSDLITGLSVFVLTFSLLFD